MYNNETVECKNHSFHILIPTMGRDSIFNTLESFKTQLNENDYLTIVFDGSNLPNINNVKKFISTFSCNSNVIVEEQNLGYWGHAIRNKYNNLPGDFVFHVDDDDDITFNCMDTIRKNCENKNTIYVFKMKLIHGDIVWKTKEIILGQIGTPSGIIPTHINSTSLFTYRCGGDYDFYKKLEKDKNNIIYVDEII